jgi:hypothetical protein
MTPRRLALGILVLLACSRTDEDAGIVLNVDADVTADRTAINSLVVTVDHNQQTWPLGRPLPGSLGIKTTPGKKSVTVEGFASGTLRGRWTGTVDAPKGSVIVQDVHLAYVGPALDAGALDSDRLDGGGSDLGATDGLGIGIDAGRLDARGTDGSAGGADGTRTLDAGPGGADGARLDSGASVGIDGGDAATDLPTAAIPDANPSGTDTSEVPSAALSGVFATSSQFDISATAAAPGSVRDALNLVHVFAQNPGAAILDYADQAGVPAAAALRAALPSALMNRLTGWMNTYIESANSNGITPYSRLVWLDDTVRALLLYWTLESQLALPVGATGAHTPRTLIFADLAGSPLAYPLDAASMVAATNVTSVIAWPGGTAAPATATISDHAFALPFGRYASPALDAILLFQYGTPDLAAYLSDAVGCAGLAAYVASQCVSIVCVGHASDLADLCEGGLAEGARQIDAQIQSIDFDAIHFQKGTATAVGAVPTRPQDTTALQDGAWTVTVDLGNGANPANATFSAAVASAAP